MANSAIPERFLVAFSLAGEERHIVAPIAEAVREQLGAPHVFYDRWFEHLIAGDEGDRALQRIYGEQSLLVVVCVSETYGNKRWTTIEYEAIRARTTLAQVSTDPRQRLGVLPIRVGDGDVPGIGPLVIAPDARSRTPEETGKLIVDRLLEIKPDVKVKGSPAIGCNWPDNPPALVWPMADHTHARDAFAGLLTGRAQFQFLAVMGPSEVGKTSMSQHMLGAALQTPELACGRLDFKGSVDMEKELLIFVQDLGVDAPADGRQLSDRLSRILEALKQRARPTLLVFDTYEKVGEAQDWMERQLLRSLLRAPWLRVVITGKEAPATAGTIWAKVSAPLVELKPPPPEAWLEWGLQFKPNLTIELVREIYELCNGRASTMADVVGPNK